MQEFLPSSSSLLCSMRPLFLQPKNKENEENGTSEDLSLLSFYGLTMYRLLHSLLLLLSSPPFIVVYVIPVWSQSRNNRPMRFQSSVATDAAQSAKRSEGLRPAKGSSLGSSRARQQGGLQTPEKCGSFDSQNFRATFQIK